MMTRRQHARNVAATINGEFDHWLWDRRRGVLYGIWYVKPNSQLKMDVGGSTEWPGWVKEYVERDHQEDGLRYLKIVPGSDGISPFCEGCGERL